MENQNTENLPVQKVLTTKDLFSKDSVKAKFQEMLGQKAQGFITSVLQIVSSNTKLTNADPMSIYNAAAIAATLDLPLNNNLGFAYIVPYNQKYQDENGQWKSKQVAQFQMGYKGFIQLSLRSGQFKKISATPIYQGQLVAENPLLGNTYDFSKKTSDIIVGYASYFSLVNGFEKDFYMPVEKVSAHGKRYSKTFDNSNGRWKEDFDGMAMKTVTKLLLSRYAPMSIEMQRAVVTDQAVINNVETEDVTYVDNQDLAIEERTQLQMEEDRKIQMLNDCKTWEEVQALQVECPDWDVKLFTNRIAEIKGGASGK